MKGWSPALRIAARDAFTHKVRSSLVLLLISLPVLVVTATLVVVMTSQLKGAEQIERRMGAADAVVWTVGAESVIQDPDPFTGNVSWRDAGPRGPGAPEVSGVLGDHARLLPMRETSTGLRHDNGRVIGLHITEVDLTDPLAVGLFELTEGRLPQGPREVVVNGPMEERGYGVGETLAIPGVAEPATVVGVGHDATLRDDEKALGPIGSLMPENSPSRFDLGQEQRWLVESGPVTWSQVQELNGLGFVVGSRSVMTDPPPPSAVPESEYEYGNAGQAEFIAVAVMVVAMALLEVVLLAGPAFAVTARSHARTLALVTASGGTPAQARRVILAGGVVLGGVATALGVVLGIGAAWLLMPLAQRASYEWFGPFEVPWLWVAVVAACGLLSAFSAAFVPAWIASRQDPVAVLAGRRADPAPRRGQPIFGLVLLALGVLGATIGAQRYLDYGPVLLTASSLVAVVGMIFVVPLVVTRAARWARTLPLPLRYAASDAARHRTRTVPAVAAVAATVAGVIAIGIGISSDQKENLETYQPAVTLGDAMVSWFPDNLAGETPPDPDQVWAELASTTHGVLPDVDVQPVRVLEESYTDTSASYWRLRLPDAEYEEGEFEMFLNEGQTEMWVGDDTGRSKLPEPVAARANAALAAGKVVVFSDTERTDERIDLVRMEETYDQVGDVRDRGIGASATLPVEFITVDSPPGASAIVPTALAEEAGMEAITSLLLLRGDIDEASEKKLSESLNAVSFEAEVYVERGYVRDAWDTVVVWALALGGGLLMLVGTLTATFLAVADARPDLATLSAVGAAPRTRRGVAASYALTIGSIGAVLGALVGFVPGIAVSRPLTTAHWREPALQGPFLDIPWLMIAGVVIALPVLTAAVVWLGARSRLPMVARVD